MGERRVAVLAAVAAVLVGLGCGLGGTGTRRAADPLPVASDPGPPSPSVEPTTEAPPPPPPTTPAAAPTTRKPKPKPSKRALPPAKKEIPPAPVKQPGQAPNCKPSYVGTAAPKATVRSALDAAAGHVYWPTSAPTIRVPKNLLYAVGWQESGWQSNIMACDGGIGTMQVMPNTVTMINNRFGTSYDVHTVSGNVMLGGGYLAWSIKYLGDLYFGGDYDLTNKPLLDAVVAAYNVGAGAVDPTKGAAGIPNPSYVSSVEALMANCPCTA
jgi:soluble lytic murein transglycosylase-like protein